MNKNDLQLWSLVYINLKMFHSQMLKALFVPSYFVGIMFNVVILKLIGCETFVWNNNWPNIESRKLDQKPKKFLEKVSNFAFKDQ